MSILMNRGGHLGEMIKPVIVLAPIEKTATFTTLSVDRLLFNMVNWTVNIGVSSPDAATLDLKVEDSADDSTFADLAATTQINFGKVVLAQILGTDDGTLFEFVTDLRGARQHIRLKGTIAGSTPKFLTGIVAILGGHVEGGPQ